MLATTYAADRTNFTVAGVKAADATSALRLASIAV